MDIIRLYLNKDYSLVLEVSWWVTVVVVLLVCWAFYRAWPLRRFHLISLDIQLGGIGKVELRPNIEDIQIAHRIWVELITRKAALPIDPEHDVIFEIYDSWHAL